MKPQKWILSALIILALVQATAGCSRSARSYVERGDAQLEQGNVDAAVLEYRNAVQKDPMFAPARLKLAEAYLRQGNGAGALDESVRAADLLPGDASAQLKAGSLLFAAGRAEDAKARAEKAIAIDPKSADAMTLRGNTMLALKDIDGALEQMRQAVALDPSANRLSNLGIILDTKGLKEEAEAAFRRSVSVDAKAITAQLALAQFLAGGGRPAEAETAFKAPVELDPGHPETTVRSLLQSQGVALDASGAAAVEIGGTLSSPEVVPARARPGGAG